MQIAIFTSDNIIRCYLKFCFRRITGVQKLLIAFTVSNNFNPLNKMFVFHWVSGEAPERIYDTMKNIFQMDMIGSPLMLKATELGGGISMAQDYGRQLAKKLE